MTNASDDDARQDAIDKHQALQRMDAVLFNATIDDDLKLQLLQLMVEETERRIAERRWQAGQAQGGEPPSAVSFERICVDTQIDGVSMIRAIFADPRLSLNAKAAATLLIAHADIETRKTIVGMRDVARTMGVSRSTAIVAFNELRQAAWLYSELVPGGRGLRAYAIMPDADVTAAAPNGEGAP